jgi:hypothetical protein
MLNQELFTLNPDENNLLNDGVVEINTALDEDGLRVIRHELRTFVCEGEYQSGIQRILSTYNKYTEAPKQPAVWVSGFFGSGKSHLVKMLGYLWEDFEFPSGETARSIKTLPQDVTDLFVELDRKQKKHGRLSVTGTLKDFPADDIRYSFLQLFLDALDLPTQYHQFKFVHWLMQEGIHDEVKAVIEAQGKKFLKEVANLFVSSVLQKAVLEVRPEFAENEAQVKEVFKANFPLVTKISRDQMISTIIDEALPLFYGDKIPCTIIVLDEVQQFIGTDGSRTIDMQNLAQDISSSFDGKFLLVCTGQNALSETPFLSPLNDRFSVKVTLSDSDVETVTRKTVLEKKPAVIDKLDKKLDGSLGEIARNLSGSNYGYITSDRQLLVADYPMLPSTRKLWKKMLQVIDTAGTSGQLRSLLRIVDESIKSVASDEMGAVISADFIFEQKQQQLLQNALLLNETNNLIEKRKTKGDKGKLEGRIISCVFLTDQLPQDVSGSRLRSDVDTIADLLISNLNQSSDVFRKEVKDAIDSLVEEKILIPIEDEYKLQTKIGAEWEKEYTSHAVKITSTGDDQIYQSRKERIVKYLADKTKTINILHGQSKLKRDFVLWDKEQRPSTESQLNIWIRDGWFENEQVVLNEIRGEGNNAPLAYAFIRKTHDAELRKELVRYLAADLTLQSKGIPTTPEGEQARKAMETRKAKASEAIDELIGKICREATITLAGGIPVQVGSLRDNIEEALNGIADRQFDEFKSKGDFKDWDKAVVKALTGDPEALKRIGWDKEPKDHPMAIEILRFIGNGTRQGKEIRAHFMNAPYGWSKDGIDAILLMLKNTEHISTPETKLTQTTISNASFKRETHTLSAKDKLALKKLYLVAGIHCKPNEEFIQSNTFLTTLIDLADQISGDAPKPEPINTQFLKDIENLDGNERLLRILEEQADLKEKYTDWKAKAETIGDRMPKWDLLSALAGHAPVTAEMEEIRAQVEAIQADRLLLQDPDPVNPVLEDLTEKLKTELNTLRKQFIEAYDKQMEVLQTNPAFDALTPEDRHAILLKNQLLTKPEIKPLDAHGLLNQLSKTSLPQWETKIAALQAQFHSALEQAVLISQPAAETFLLARTTISTPEEIEEYVTGLKEKLEKLIAEGKTIILK